MKLRILQILLLFLCVPTFGKDSSDIDKRFKEAIDLFVQEESNFYQNRFLVTQRPYSKNGLIWIYWLENRMLMRFDEGQNHPYELFFGRNKYKLGEGTAQTESEIPFGSTFFITDQFFMERVLYCYENGSLYTVFKTQQGDGINSVTSLRDSTP